MTRRHHHLGRNIGTRTDRTRAFTLLELTASIAVIAIVAAVTLPLVDAAADSYASAVDVREKIDRVAYAMERAVHLVREAPSDGPGLVGISSAAAGRVVFADGRGLELSGGVLWMIHAPGDRTALCPSVTSFVLSYLGSDGRTDTRLTPTQTQRVNITLVAGGVQLRSSAFVRARTVDP